MGGSYRQCVECGKRALSIATRCPGCGREFPVREEVAGGPAAQLGRFRSPGVAAGVLATAAVFAAVTFSRGGGPSDRQAPSSAADSVAGSSEVGYTATTRRLERTSVAAATAASASEVLVARDWTHVRKARSRRADLEAILTPGDTVVADSLERDWYRVAFEGEVLGYVHRSTLKASN
jgi:hypothetical protein